MADLNVFSDADVALLKEMANWFRNRGTQSTREDDEWEPRQSPEVYIALVPTNGIPALTGGETTGATPCKVECQAFQIGPQGELTSAATGHLITVYNLGASGVPQGWCLIARDKWGKWIATPTPTFLVGKVQSAVTQGEFGDVQLYDNGGLPITNSLGLVPTGETVSALFVLGSVGGLAGTADDPPVWVILVPVGWGYLAINISCFTSSGTST